MITLNTQKEYTDYTEDTENTEWMHRGHRMMTQIGAAKMTNYLTFNFKR